MISGFGAGGLRTDSLDGGNDIFVMRFDATTGAPLALLTLAGPGDDRAAAFAVKRDVLVVSGTFTQTLAGVGDGGLYPPAGWTTSRGFVGTVAR